MGAPFVINVDVVEVKEIIPLFLHSLLSREVQDWPKIRATRAGNTEAGMLKLE